MTQQKYYDYKLQKPIDIEMDGCSFEDWQNGTSRCPFAKHPKGFLLFSPSSEINKQDEYSGQDPYSVADNLQSDFHRRRISCTLELVAEAINGNEDIRLLDLGCGQGHFTSRIKSEYPKMDVSGLDYSISAIGYAIENYMDIDFALGNAYDLPYTRKYFDVVVCNNLWEHVPDPLNLLSEISKVLKPDGYLILSTPSRFRVENIIRLIDGLDITFMSDLHITEYTIGQVVEQLKYGGYKKIKFHSREIQSDLDTINSRWKYKLILFFIQRFLRRSNLEHSLCSTIFYLAKNS